MIILDELTLLSRGSERECHNYPEKKDKVIKVIYNQKNENNQNILEYKYYQYLEKKKIDFSHITRCYGWVETNLGWGLIFEKICNFDGSKALNLRTCFMKKIFNDESEKKLLNELKTYLEKELILFIDATSLNVLFQKLSKDESRFIIIDGLGAKRMGIKFFLYLHMPFYVKYKVRKQWNIFLANIERVKRKIELNKQL